MTSNVKKTKKRPTRPKVLPKVQPEDLALIRQILKPVTIDILKGTDGRIIKISVTAKGVRYYIRFLQDEYLYYEWFFRDEITFIGG